MKVSVRYFAALREQLGAGEEVELAPGATLGGLREQLIATSAAHADALGRHHPVRMAHQQRVADEDQRVDEGAEVAFFPPMTGG